MLRNKSYSNYSSMITYDETGENDYLDLFDEMDTAYTIFEQDAGYVVTENLLDSSARTFLRNAGWHQERNPHKQAIDWFYFDWEYVYPPEQSSGTFLIANYNATFYRFSEDANYVIDQRPSGFRTIIVGEAATFLNCTTSPDYDCSADPRLLLNTTVTNITYTATDSVTITNADGSCITADYVICTFSIGVLQASPTDTGGIAFNPPLPSWKRTAINEFQMGTFTKVFLQFSTPFWDTSTQFFLYADPVRRGHYALFQNLDHPDFLPGSGIIFVTVLGDESAVVEAQDDDTTREQILEVMRTMWGEDAVASGGEVLDFLYPRWGLEPWVRGSYSNWPPGMTLEEHQNLRASLGRLYFAGEATSSQYFGYLQGAYYEGVMAGEKVAACVSGQGEGCEQDVGYEVLKGTTPPGDYNVTNGWTWDQEDD